MIASGVTLLVRLILLLASASLLSMLAANSLAGAPLMLCVGAILVGFVLCWRALVKDYLAQ